MAEGQGHYCTECGAQVAPDARFCSNCGKVLGENAPPDPPEPDRIQVESIPVPDPAMSSAPESAPSGPGLSSRASSWFGRQSPRWKAIILIAAVVLFVVLSPAIQAIAVLLLAFSVVALFVQMVRSRRLKGPAYALVGSLIVLFVAGGVSSALYGDGTSSGQAESGSAAEETTIQEASQSNVSSGSDESRDNPGENESEQISEVAATEDVAASGADADASGADADGDGATKTAQQERSEPPPPTPDEQLRAKIRKTFISLEDMQNLSVQNSGGGCFNVSVEFVSEGLTAGGTVDTVEYQMADIYEAAYSKPDPPVCVVKTTAYSTLVDNYGNETKEPVYTTTMNRATGEQINWKNVYAVDLPSLWTENFVSPAYERQRTQNQIDQAVDCAEDEGLFDIDIDCP